MLHSVKLANSAAVVYIVYAIIVLLLAAMVPDLAVIAPGYGALYDQGAINWGYLILGFIISAAIVWILVYATISLYNKML